MTFEELYVAGYPLYALETQGSKVVFGGGGGPSASGVPNILEIHDLDEESFPVLCLENTGKVACMGITAHPSGESIVCGLDQLCQRYSVKQEDSTDSKGDDDDDDSKTDETKDGDADKASATTSKIILIKENSVDTDKGADNYQKVARFNRTGTKLLTGGSEGIVRLWSYPDLKEMKQVEKMGDEIRDIQFHPNNDSCVVISSDGAAVIIPKEFLTSKLSMKEQNDKKIKIAFSQSGLKYSAVGCGFATDQTTKHVLLYICIVHKTNPSYVVVYDADDNFKEVKRAKLVKDSVTKFVMSPNEDFFAVGTKTGTIAIYNSHSLKMATSSVVHSWIVTGVAWSGDGKKVLSISPDMRVCATVCAVESNEVLYVILLSIFLFIMYILLDYVTEAV